MFIFPKQTLLNRYYVKDAQIPYSLTSKLRLSATNNIPIGMSPL